MILVLVACAILSLAAVGVHYEVLRAASAAVDLPHIRPRARVGLAVLFALVAHVLEVLVFAVGWGVFVYAGETVLSGAQQHPSDILYFSLVSYTSLGYGDIVPLGPARILAGIESLVGLVLIAWTSSFTFFEMRRYWREDPR